MNEAGLESYQQESLGGKAGLPMKKPYEKKRKPGINTTPLSPRQTRSVFLFPQ